MTSPVPTFALEGRSLAASSPRRASVAIVAFVALWAAVEAVVALAFRSITLWEVVFLRYVIHVAIVLAVWGRKAPWRTRRLKYQLGRSALMLIMPSAFILALMRGATLAWVDTSFWSAPLFVLVFAMLIEHEHARLATWAAAALGIVAAWLYFSPAGVPSPSAIGLGLASAASFALYIPMTRRLDDEPVRTNLFYTAIVPLAGLAPFMPHVWATPAFSELIALTFVGSVGLISLLVLERATEAGPVSPTAPLLHLEVGFLMLLLLVAHAFPNPRRAAASIAVLLATAALAWPALQSGLTEIVP